jgi:4-hydroxybenzoate polyprenyltransferase
MIQSASHSMNRFIHKVRVFLEMIKFEHTVFALPFAYLGYIFGAGGEIYLPTVGWITLVMASARTAGMCLNRLCDVDVDAKNPRTRGRALVTGALSQKFAAGAIAVSFILLFIGVWQLPPICLRLLPVAVVLLVAYHYMKRFTVLCHFGAGLVLACAPMGGWLAATGRFEPGAWALSLGVMLWVAGFDMFYSLQDADFDRSARLYSIPARYGEETALKAAAWAHTGVLILFVTVGIMVHLGPIYWVAIGAAAGLLVFEHFLVRQDREKYVNAAFFTLNGIMSIVFCTLAAFSMPLKFVGAAVPLVMAQ